MEKEKMWEGINEKGNYIAVAAKINSNKNELIPVQFADLV